MKYGYARVSTKGQARNGNSLADQTKLLIEAGVDPENIFSDSFTGTKLDRPEFTKVLGLLKTGDTLVVCKLDRFARTASDGSALVTELLERGIKVHILNMGLIENSPTGRLIANVLLSFAEFERDMIVERTQAGKEIARQRPDYKEGRPSKRTDDMQATIASVRAGELTQKQAAAQLGISERTIRRYLKGEM